MTNPIPITAVPSKVNKGLVWLLEGCLLQAKKGKLIGAMVIGESNCGGIYQGNALSTNQNLYQMAGALDTAKTQVVSEIIQNAEKSREYHDA